MLGIGVGEYHERQAAMRRLAARSGLQGVVAWSRGGAAQDRYADVYHLTGCYQNCRQCSGLQPGGEADRPA
ncbi:hypothetical protein ABGB18_19255 [Nonomuraea sp. B12E4]|uniref:hypothetical protein n=1 Tax=Nonomuraea sp. B12E4 TaxID=3153564 RepID=UPI00325DC369